MKLYHLYYTNNIKNTLYNNIQKYVIILKINNIILMILNIDI